MTREDIIDNLNEILLQFEYNVLEADMGETDAIEALQSNENAVEALKEAIKIVKQK